LSDKDLLDLLTHSNSNLGDTIKGDEMGVMCDMYGGKRNAGWVLVG
jgi:hypothetical protein